MTNNINQENELFISLRNDLTACVKKKNDSFSGGVMMIQSHWNDLKNYVKHIKNNVNTYNDLNSPQKTVLGVKIHPCLRSNSFLLGISIPLIIQALLEITKASFDKVYILGLFLVAIPLLIIGLMPEKETKEKCLFSIEHYINSVEERINEIESYNMTSK